MLHVVLLFLAESDLKVAFDFQVLNLKAEIFNFISSTLNGMPYDTTELALFTKCIILSEKSVADSAETPSALSAEDFSKTRRPNDNETIEISRLETDLEIVYAKILSEQIVPCLLNSISQMNIEVFPFFHCRFLDFGERWPLGYFLHPKKYFPYLIL